jgi:release factor glutamine methyltransferase
MDVYRRLVPQAWAALRRGGLLAMEIGQGQREAIAELLAGWGEVRFVEDLRGIARVVVARRG